MFVTLHSQVGTWTGEDGYTETRTIIPPIEQEGSESMRGKHFIVLTALVCMPSTFMNWILEHNK